MRHRLRAVLDEVESAAIRLAVRMRVALTGLLVLAPACGPDPGATIDGLATVAVMMPLDEYGLSRHRSSQAQLLVFSPLVARDAKGAS